MRTLSSPTQPYTAFGPVDRQLNWEGKPLGRVTQREVIQALGEVGVPPQNQGEFAEQVMEVLNEATVDGRRTMTLLEAIRQVAKCRAATNEQTTD